MHNKSKYSPLAVLKETTNGLFPTRQDKILAVVSSIITLSVLLGTLHMFRTLCLTLEEMNDEELAAVAASSEMVSEEPSTPPATENNLEKDVTTMEYVTMPDIDGDTMLVDKEIINCIIVTSKEHHVPPKIALSICYVESGFDPSVNNEGTNGDGTTDWGVMQLNDQYFEYYQDKYNYGLEFDPLNYSDNVRIGMGILSDLCDYWDCSVYDVAGSYNMGISGWEEYVAEYGWSWEYADTVLEYYYALEDYEF